MDIKSQKIKTKTNYNWDDMVYVYDFCKFSKNN